MKGSRIMIIVDIKKLFKTEEIIPRNVDCDTIRPAIVDISYISISDKKDVGVYDTDKSQLYKLSSNEIYDQLRRNGSFANMHIYSDTYNDFCHINSLNIYNQFIVYDNVAYYMMRGVTNNTTALVFWYNNEIYLTNTWLEEYDEVVGFSFSKNKFMPYKFNSFSYIKYSNIMPKMVTPELLIERGAKKIKEMSLVDFRNKCLSGYFFALAKLSIRE